MVAVASTMLGLGYKAPDFNLPNYNLLYPSVNVAREDFSNKVLVVAFICNHCPYVVVINEVLTQIFNRYQENEVAIVAICSNDAKAYPADSPAQMIIHAKESGYLFPYLFDETQQIAQKYHAACTPDFYVFNKNHILEYRGQFCDARPNKDATPTGEDLMAAIDQVIKGKAPADNQKPSLGCNIKWKEGNEPDYF